MTVDKKDPVVQETVEEVIQVIQKLKKEAKESFFYNGDDVPTVTIVSELRSHFQIK